MCCVSLLLTSILVSLRAVCGNVLEKSSNVLYDGRAPLTLTADDLDNSNGPYLTCVPFPAQDTHDAHFDFSAVKGQNESASYYTKFQRFALPTPLHNLPFSSEQVLAISIDNTSVFVPGGGPPQLGFRRTELIAQVNKSSSLADSVMEIGTTTFHFSIQADILHPLNYKHEYQIVFIEPSDGTHVFGVQLGSPFTNPTGPLPAPNAHSFKILDHALNVLFSTPFLPLHWHNFAITVDWDNRTLAVAYSLDAAPLKTFKPATPNPTVAAGVSGDFHFGVLKLPLVDPKDTLANQGDVVHHGIQEGTTEALLYSGVFVTKGNK
ncbi:E3 ubiquitin-protein ligase hel2 [Mycena indigotica]|uniref:E3 ubiquitin-protein ligase hel2 n=1 Tax=Mycena indigotica TaxID=2126181 RepID=A0A8H6WAL5_9AGAR|nr:E3 ubiquitin-protein ligase hel2 [Mycena indigotica]KAF7309271.1 E3 ubiquitin-protein ligase hel2 [Mycena indigotica]